MYINPYFITTFTKWYFDSNFVVYIYIIHIVSDSDLIRQFNHVCSNEHVSMNIHVFLTISNYQTLMCITQKWTKCPSTIHVWIILVYYQWVAYWLKYLHFNLLLYKDECSNHCLDNCMITMYNLFVVRWVLGKLYFQNVDFTVHMSAFPQQCYTVSF